MGLSRSESSIVEHKSNIAVDQIANLFKFFRFHHGERLQAISLGTVMYLTSASNRIVGRFNIECGKIINHMKDRQDLSNSRP